MLGVLRRLLTVSSGLVVFFLLFPLNSLFAERPLKESTSNPALIAQSAPECAVPLTFDDVKKAFNSEVGNHVSVNWDFIYSRDSYEGETCKNSKLLITLRGQFSELHGALDRIQGMVEIAKTIVTVPSGWWTGSVKFDKKSKILTVELNPEADVWENGQLIEVYYIPISAEEIVRVASR